MNEKDDMIQKFRQFLNIHWLRPEAAFFKIYDYSVLKDIFPLPEPSIDIACGDGITSFIWAEGEFDKSFDMYKSVKNTDIMYDKNVDVFDSCSTAIHPAVIKRPDWHFTYGLDLKETLIKKAAALGFYEKLKVHNLDDPMPYTDKFNSAFSTTFFAPGKENCFTFRIKADIPHFLIIIFPI